MLGRSRTRFRLLQRGTLIPPVDGLEIGSFGVGPSGEPVVLWTGADQASVTVHGSADPREAVTLHGLPEGVVAAQPLPDGRVLVVGARAEWRESGPQRNAVVCAPDGSVERSACLGDGIEHVQVAADGAIWVGYFDEGVYGNLGWGGSGPEPIGAPGIVRFSSALDIAWRYPVDDLEPIDDCYALNVSGEDVWACCYAGFDVVRIRDGAVRSWTNELEGARAIVATGDEVALFGGYDKDRDRLVVGNLDLDDDELEVVGTGRLTMPNGRRLPQDAVVVGRGEEIHVLVGLEWFTWSVADHD